MSLTLHPTFTNKNPTTSSLLHLSHATHFSKLLSNSPFPPPISRTRFPTYRFPTSQPRLFPLTKTNAATSQNRTDDFLSILEFLSLASSAAISVYAALSSIRLPKGGVLGWVGSKFFVWQCVVLVSGVLVGAVIRRRQWRRLCGDGFSGGSASSIYGADLLGRVEKLEEDLRGSATIIRVLSRQLEKLGTRIRVTRKDLKEPISEAAALAQKNSEATQALAAQEDILERELGEIQNMLLAMQEQQQKQLELILAIGKAGKLWETKSSPTKDQNASKTSADGLPNSQINRIEKLALENQANNNRT